MNAGRKSVTQLEAMKPRPGERLDGADLHGLSLEGVRWFADVVLIGTDFSNADVTGVDFSDADLRKSSFGHSTARNAIFEGANLEDADVNDVDLRGTNLKMARLDETDLSSSRIGGNTAFGERAVYEAEMDPGDDPGTRRDKLEAAIRTYRALERLSQENALHSQASTFYRRGKDLRRRFNWSVRNYLPATMAELSRWFTGYGNLPLRVIYTSLGVILLCGLLYPLLGGIRRPRPTGSTIYALDSPWAVSVDRAATIVLESLYFSVVTFTTLGFGDLEPVGTAAQYLASAEALLGSILMALLVAVLTRSTWLR